ncbi:MAG: hypothetical protein KC766_01165 [Myxococcales bacterium]|nr:hypothetical protein [Myxococcales bacterium]
MRGLWLLLVPIAGCASGGDIATNDPGTFGGSGGEQADAGGGSGGAQTGGSGGSGTAWGGSAGTGASSSGGSQSSGGTGGGSAGMSTGGTPSGGMGGTGGNCECQPGVQETEDCGNCGTRSRSCGNDCLWDTWSGCGNEGPCAPGTTQPGACDSCSEQVCQNDCSWGGCELKVGNECDWNMGHHWRCCGVDSWQFCLSSCKWSTACETNLTNADCCSGPGPSC